MQEIQESDIRRIEREAGVVCCSVDNVEHSGFAVPESSGSRIHEVCEKFKNTLGIRTPTVFVTSRGTTCFLSPRPFMSASRSLEDTGLLRLDRTTETINQLVGTLEILSRHGYSVAELTLDDFEIDFQSERLCLVNLAKIIAPKPEFEKGLQALGRMIAHFLGGANWSTIKDLRACRPQCPERYFSVVDRLLYSPSKIDFEDVRSHLQIYTKASGSVKTATSLEESMLADVLFISKTKNLSVILHGEEKNAIHSLATDLARLLPQVEVFDALDPSSHRALIAAHDDAKNIIAMNAHLLSSDDVAYLDAKEARIIYVVQANLERRGSRQKFVHLPSVKVDYRAESISGTFKSRSIAARAIAKSVPPRFFESVLPLCLYTLYFRVHEVSDELPTMAEFCDGLKRDELGLSDEALGWLHASQVWGAIDVEFLAGVGIDAASCASLCDVGLAYKVIIGGRECLRYAGSLQGHMPDILPLVKFLRNNNAIPGKWLVDAIGQLLITPEEQEMCELASLYAARGLLGEVSNLIENYCRQQQSNRLLAILMENLSQIDQLQYEWHSHIAKSNQPENVKLQQLENLVDYYKTRNSHKSSLEVGRVALKILGISTSDSPSLLWIYATFIWIFIQIRVFGIRRFLNMTDEMDSFSRIATTTKIAMKVGVSGFIASPKSYAEIALKIILYTRNQKLTPSSPGLIMALAQIVGNYAFSLRTARNIHSYCMEIITKYNLEEARPQVDFMYLSTIAPYIDEDNIGKRMRDSFKLAKTKNPEWASYLSGAENSYAFYKGEYNGETLARIDQNIPYIEEKNQTTPIAIHKIIRRFLKAMNTDLRLVRPVNIVEDDGTALFADACSSLILHALINSPEAISYYDQMKRYIFGVKGQPILYVGQQAALHTLLKEGRRFEILLVALQFAFFYTCNPRSFGAKTLHGAAYLARAFGMGIVAINLLIEAARQAEAHGLTLDAAIIHLHISLVMKDSALSRHHRLLAADMFESMGHRGISSHLLGTLSPPRRASNSAPGLLDLVQWLMRQMNDVYIFPSIEAKLEDVLNAERVCCTPATVTPPQELEEIYEQAKRGPVLEKRGQISQFCSTLFVDGSHYSTLYIEFRSGNQDEHRVFAIMNTVQLGLLSYAQREKLQSALARERRIVEAFPIWQHEVGQPLSFIASIAERGIYNQSISQDDVRAIHDAALEISRIVDAFSEISPDSKQVLEISPVCLSDEIRSLIVRTERGCENKKLGFSQDIMIPRDLWILTDQRLLRSILKNLADNAVKYTDRGEVCISAFVDLLDNDAYFTFTVQDTGIGIAKDNLQKIFEPRFREDIDRSTTRKHSSLGVGLSQVKSYTESLGGEVTVSSDSGGSEFRFRCRFTLSNPSHNDRIEACYEGLTALVIDDSYDNLNETRRVLEEAQITTYTTTLPAEGIKLAISGYLDANGEYRPYDVIFCDIEMPELDGRDVAEAIKAQGINTPIVALTAYPKLKESPRNKFFVSVLRKHLSKKSLTQTLTEKLKISPTTLKISRNQKPEKASSAASSLINLELARKTFSDIDINRYLDQLDGLLRMAKERFKALEAESNADGISKLAHTVVNPLYTLGSPACEAFDQLQGDDPLAAIKSVDHQGIIGQLLAEIPVIQAKLELPKDIDETKIHATFREFLIDENSQFFGWYFQYKDTITKGMDDATVASLTHAIDEFNAPEALAIYGRFH